MSQLFAFRRPLRFVALALCSASIFVFVSPASARPQHGAGRHAHAYHAGHHAKHRAHRPHRQVRMARRVRAAEPMQAGGFAEFNPTYTPMTAPAGFGPQNVAAAPAERAGRRSQRRHARQETRWERAVAQMRARGLADANAGIAPAANVSATAAPAGGAMASGYGSSGLVAEARKHLGGNPTGRGSLWCARFMNMVLQHSGYRGTGSDMASSFAKYGQRVSGPQVGAIAVMTRGRRGGHVGIITGIDAKGNPIMISGNNGNRVREAPVSRGRIYAYVMPTN
jgi:uncharacterized protein (TIGR02594 family)